ncbi:MAG: MFS transporter [Pirellulales bacterium]
MPESHTPVDESLENRLAPRAAGGTGQGPVPVRRNLRASLLDAGLFSVMVGLGETFFSAYVLALDGGEIAAGLIIALPLLAGACLQLLAPWIVRRWVRHQNWVVATAVLQAISLLIMPLAQWAGSYAVAVAFAAATVYWGAGLSSGPAWNTWIEGIVPRRMRTRFFALRVRISQACILGGFVLGGFSLQFGQQSGATLQWFTAIFLVSAGCRLASAWHLSRHRECPRRGVSERHVSWGQLVRGGQTVSSRRLLIYLFAVQVAVYISGPYFAPFILSKLEISYRTYALLIGLTFVGKVLALPAWGRLAHYSSPRRLLWIGGVSIVPISGLWMVSQSLPFLAVLQLAGGVTWAAYELAIVLLFFESIPREERTSVLTIYNFGNSLAQVVGALAGAWWLREFGRSVDSYLWLFVASSVARATTTALLARIPAARPIDERLESPSVVPAPALHRSRPATGTLSSASATALAPREQAS